ncbi:hypothetical protein [Thiomicrorhabdus sp. 6S3-12]|uniref:hypothetical protein n=1 Tax=Thiomicrorhabdus sp. 6S3-12 TaxID=2819681 RepID=UPI001AAC5E34|nr:hypothetical protein [Thiomicrorhabdus sp. 6S3-12]MBO1923194.1 hypothetical protein [Thiomicrorhabdus sp. 6S3-12]
MPGTHYDNDHSFIESLPTELKLVAYRIIRKDSLETMLLNLRSQHSKEFDAFPKLGQVSDEKKERTIHACIVAKITGLDKTLYINSDHEVFINEVLFKSLRFLSKRALEFTDESDETLLDYLKLAHSKTYQWLHKSDNEDRRTLAIRKRFQNTRRYFRYRAKLKYHFIRIGSQEGKEELTGDIYTTGIQHFTKIVNEKLDILHANYHTNIRQALAKPFPAAYQLFMVVIERLEYLRKVLNGISVGVLPIEEAKRSLRQGVEQPLDYASLSGNIRTESILRDFEEKIDQISASTLTLLEKSTPHQLYDGPVLKKLKIDKDIVDYQEKREKNRSYLLSSFIDLYNYAQLLEKIYNNISASNYIIIFPEYWSEHYHDASPVGFSFYSEFLVSVNDILELFFQLDLSDDPDKNVYDVIHQKVKVVRIDEHPDMGFYQISCQFLAPAAETMNTLRKALQSKEVIDAFESAAFMGEENNPLAI